MTLNRDLTRVVCLLLVAGCATEEATPPTIEEQHAPLTVPAGFINETLVTGLSNATSMTFAPDGRLFVCEQAGKLRIIQSGQLLATPFLTVPVDSAGERGLLGVTFDPAFASNGFVYVYYTAKTPNLHNRLSRFTAAGNVAASGSEVVLLDLDPLTSATNHNGGAIAFGADGKLYVAVGENATRSNAQSFGNLLGKMLRMNADGSVPADNPFLSSTTGKNRLIWALGLRNPFTFALQPGTGTMFINDVGENSWEEINQGAAGANYGWPTVEGASSDPRFKAPRAAYGHGSSGSTGCAITGGAFYNPATVGFPSSYVGKYFFADYCSQWIRVFDPSAGGLSSFATGVSAPVDLDVGADGALYYLARGAGAVGRVRASGSQPPQVTASPQDLRRATGQSATFTVTATGDAPLSYQWQRNSVSIAGATAASYTIAAVAGGDNGASFRAIVNNPFGTATSAAAQLTVVAGSLPAPVITAPAAGATYAAGQTLAFAGSATDPEDGNLPASAFTWEIIFHHDTHTHPFMLPTSGVTAGSGVIPNRGETATNVFYRVRLTVTDSTGLTATVVRDVAPRVATVALQTSPPGLQVMLDGQMMTAPVSVSSVVGLIRSIGAVSPQSQNGVGYTFGAWSDGGAATHDIATPETSTSYVASYSSGPPANVIPAGGGTVTGNTSGGASASAGSCAAESSSAPERTFTWTPQISGAATVHTCNAQVKFDTVLYVSREGAASQLACNDDTSGCATGDPSSNAGHHGSKVTFQVVAGQTYTIVVDGFAGSSGGSAGAFALTVVAPSAPPPPPPPPPPPADGGAPSDSGAPADSGTPPPDSGSTADSGPPPSDAAAPDSGGRPVIPPGGGTASGSTSGASTTSGLCASAATGSAPDQVIQWTPNRSGRATAHTCSGQVTFDTVLYVRNAASGGQELACNDDTSGCATGDRSANAGQHGSRIAFDVVAGQTYFFVVDGYAGSTGGSAGTFLLTVTAPP